MRTNIVVHQLWHHASSINADALGAHLVADVFCAYEQILDGIDDGIGHVAGIGSGLCVGQNENAQVLVGCRTGTLRPWELATLVIVVQV